MNVSKSSSCGIGNAVKMTTTYSFSIIFSDRIRTVDPCPISTGKDMITSGSKSIASPSEEFAVFVKNVCECMKYTRSGICVCFFVCAFVYILVDVWHFEWKHWQKGGIDRMHAGMKASFRYKRGHLDIHIDRWKCRKMANSRGWYISKYVLIYMNKNTIKDLIYKYQVNGRGDAYICKWIEPLLLSSMPCCQFGFKKFWLIVNSTPWNTFKKKIAPKYNHFHPRR